MNKIYQKAYAKVNIGLDVLRRRTDGYHEVKMIMQTVDIYDELVLEKREQPGIISGLAITRYAAGGAGSGVRISPIPSDSMVPPARQ